jgi:hypothetical protein
MKDISKKMLATATVVAGGAALGIFLVKLTRDSGVKKAGDSPCAARKRERLLFVRNKLEEHRERLDKHLSRINARIEAASKAKTPGDMNSETVLFKPDPSLV